MLLEQFNIVDVEKTHYDVSKIKVVPTIVVNNNRAMSGRDAFAWLQNEVKNMVTGVESHGTSAAFTYLNDDRAECTMSTKFVNINDVPEASSSSTKDDNGKNTDINTEMDRLQAERSLI